jgi:hypothetical protein
MRCREVATLDDATFRVAELLMRVAWKDVARVRFDCVHAGNSATEYFEFASFHTPIDIPRNVGCWP